MTTLHTRITRVVVDTRALENLTSEQMLALQQAVGRAILYGIHDRGAEGHPTPDVLHYDAAALAVGSDGETGAAYYRSSGTLDADKLDDTVAAAMRDAAQAGERPFFIAGIPSGDRTAYSHHS